MTPYVKRAIASHPASDHRAYARIRDIEAISRAGHALSQACCVPDAFQAAVAGEAIVWRDYLATALEAIDAAILDVYANLEIPVPSFASSGLEGVTPTLKSEPITPHSKEPSSPVLSDLVRERKRLSRTIVEAARTIAEA